MRTIIHIALALVAGIGIAACGGEGAERSAVENTDFSPVMALVGGQPITRGYFDYCYENLSPADQAKFSGEGWEERFLDFLIERELIVQSAEEENLDLIREMEWRLKLARQSVLYKAYKDKHYGGEVEIPEEEIVAAYEGNPDAFRIKGRMRADHIRCASKEKIDQAWAELEAGEHWARVCQKYSEDEESRPSAGSLGWFNPGGYVLGMGINEEFTDVAFALEAHTVAPPVQIDGNWHIIRTHGKLPGEVQPLEEVRERIVRMLRPGFAREQEGRDVRRMREETGVEYRGQFASPDRRSAEALYRLAAATRDPHAKIKYYGRVVELYPEHELADEALFMQGFVFSEEFSDVTDAARCFRRLKADYPESEYVDEADWMMQNLGRAVPELRGEELPGSAEEVDARIKEWGN